MQRFVRCLCVVGTLFLCAPGLLPRGWATDPPSRPESTDSLIAGLNNIDPTVRSSATTRLMGLGTSVHRTLRLALPDAPPETAQRILYILQHIDWNDPQDTQASREAMSGYADSPPDARRDMIYEKLAAQGTAAADVLARILERDTNSSVRWSAAAVLAAVITPDSPAAARIIDRATHEPAAGDVYPLPQNNAAMLGLAGFLDHTAHPERADRWMHRALELEADHPTAFYYQMDFIFGLLLTEAQEYRHFDAAVELLHQQCDHTPMSDSYIPEPVGALIALNVDYGPFPGFANDLRLYRQYMMTPQMMYAFARLLQREHFWGFATTLRTIAMACGGISVQSHYATGVYLAQHEWNNDARRELQMTLLLSGGTATNVYWELSKIESDTGNDFDAAQYMEKAVNTMTDDGNPMTTMRDGRSVPWTKNDGWAEVHWLYLRAAREAHDLKAVQLHVDALLKLDHDHGVLQGDPGKAADIVPALQELKRADEADDVFDTYYKVLLDEVNTNPKDPMPKNNLAWLCARSGKKLDEAIKYSDQAVALTHSDPACLDTQAEAYFDTGKTAQAVEIETRAVNLKPDDTYMHRQLERYRKAIKR